MSYARFSWDSDVYVYARANGILDKSCAELAPTAISYHEYSAMPINNSGDQLLV